MKSQVKCLIGGQSATQRNTGRNHKKVKSTGRDISSLAGQSERLALSCNRLVSVQWKRQITRYDEHASVGRFL